MNSEKANLPVFAFKPEDPRSVRKMSTISFHKGRSVKYPCGAYLKDDAGNAAAVIRNIRHSEYEKNKCVLCICVIRLKF